MDKFRLIGEVSETAFEQFSDVLDSGDGPLLLDINSTGGNSYDMLAFVDKIRCSSRPIIGTGYGSIQSAAVLILAMCDTRRVAPSAWFMVHEDSHKLSDSTSLLKRTIDQNVREERQWCELMSACTNLTAEEWAYLSNKTTYFGAERALELGVVDRILPVRTKKTVKTRGSK